MIDLKEWDAKGVELTSDRAPCWEIIRYERCGVRLDEARPVLNLESYVTEPSLVREGRVADRMTKYVDALAEGRLRMFRQQPDEFVRADKRIIVESAGWPFPALCSVHHLASDDGTGAFFHDDNVLIIYKKLPPSIAIEDRAAVYICPLWPGFAIDLVVFVGAWWLFMNMVRWWNELVTTWSHARRNISLLVLLSLGVVSTFAATWVCVWRANLDKTEPAWKIYSTSSEPSQDGYACQDGYGMWLLDVRRWTTGERVSSSWTSCQIRDVKSRSSSQAMREMIPSWAEGITPSHYGHPYIWEHTITERRGWPLPAMRSEVTVRWEDGEWDSVRRFMPSTQSDPLTKHGFLLSCDIDQSQRRIRAMKMLPYGIVWPGFALNTLLYAFGWGTLCIVPMIIRRRLRYAEGLCSRCGYDLRGAINERCSECGTLSPRGSP